MAWMLYCETTALLATRLMSEIAPSVCDAAPVAVMGRFRRAVNVSIWYCGVCMTIGYDAPLSGLSQYVGATWLLPARFTTMLLVTSRSVKPTYWARVRSTSTLKPGLLKDC